MKYLTIIISFLSLACLAQDTFHQRMVQAGNAVYVSSGGGGTSGDLLSTDFESGGTPTGWTLDSGSVNFHNTTSPLSGTADCLLSASTAGHATGSFTAKSEVWVTFQFSVSAAPNNYPRMFYVGDSTGTQEISIGVDGSSKFGMYQNGVLLVQTTTVVPTDGTRIYVRFHVKNGSGANAVYDAEWSTTGTFSGSGNQFCSYSSGSQSLTFGIVELNQNALNTNNWHVDNINVYSTAQW